MLFHIHYLQWYQNYGNSGNPKFCLCSLIQRLIHTPIFLNHGKNLADYQISRNPSWQPFLAAIYLADHIWAKVHFLQFGLHVRYDIPHITTVLICRHLVSKNSNASDVRDKINV